MFRSLTVAAVAALGLLATSPAPANAQPPRIRVGISIGRPNYERPNYGRPGYGPGYVSRYPGSPFVPPVINPAPSPVVAPFPGPGPVQEEHHYHVLYRRCIHDRWEDYGCYCCAERAHEARDFLRAQGFQARVTCD